MADAFLFTVSPDPGYDFGGYFDGRFFVCIPVEEYDFYAESAWTAVEVSPNSDGSYRDVVSNDYAMALFFEGDRVTIIRDGESFSSAYTKNSNGFEAVVGTDMPFEATIEGDSIYLSMLGTTWLLKECDIASAVSYAQCLVGNTGMRIPFADETAATPEDTGNETFVTDTADNTTGEYAYSFYDDEVLVDDDLCRIVSHGKEMIKVYGYSVERPAYLLSVTNRASRSMEIYTGHVSEDDFDYTVGTVNGQIMSALAFIDSKDEKHYEGILFSSILPGETVNLYMEPLGGGYGFTSVDELRNVIANIYVSLSNPGGDFQYRNYTLKLDEGIYEEYTGAPGVVQYENDYFVCDLPSDWQAVTYYEGTEYEYDMAFPPPELSIHLTRIEFNTNPLQTVQSLVDEYNEDHKAFYADPEDSLKTYTVSIGGRSAEVVEQYNHIADATYYTYFMTANDGKEIMIDFISEMTFESELNEIRQQVLSSIRFK